jgi:hypothetical protein
MIFFIISVKDSSDPIELVAEELPGKVALLAISDGHLFAVAPSGLLRSVLASLLILSGGNNEIIETSPLYSVYQQGDPILGGVIA